MPDACCFVDDEGSKIELRAVETDINGGADDPLSLVARYSFGAEAIARSVRSTSWNSWNGGWDNKICLFDGADLPMWGSKSKTKQG